MSENTNHLSSRVLQKALKRREPQRHKIHKRKALPGALCAFVVQGFYAFCDSLLLEDDGRGGDFCTALTASITEGP